MDESIAAREAAVEVSPLQVEIVRGSPSLVVGAGTPAYVRVTYPEGSNGVRARIQLQGSATSLLFPQDPYSSPPLGACSETFVYVQDAYNCSAVTADTLDCVVYFAGGSQTTIPLCLGASVTGAFSVTATAQPQWVTAPPATASWTGSAVTATGADVRLTRLESGSPGTFVGLPSTLKLNLSNLGPEVAADTTLRLRVTRGAASFPDEETRLPVESPLYGGFWMGWCRRDADGAGVTCPLGGLSPLFGTSFFAEIAFVPQAPGALELTAEVTTTSADRSADDNRRVLAFDAQSVPTYDLGIEKVETMTKTVAGRPLVQRITVKNFGPSPALGPNRLSVSVNVAGEFTGFASGFPLKALRLVSGPPGSSCTVSAPLADCVLGVLPSGSTAVIDVESLPAVADSYSFFAVAVASEFHIDSNPMNDAVFNFFAITKGRQVLSQLVTYFYGKSTVGMCGGTTAPVNWFVQSQLKSHTNINDSHVASRLRSVEVDFGFATFQDGSGGGAGRTFRFVRGRQSISGFVDRRDFRAVNDDQVDLLFADAAVASGGKGTLLRVQAHLRSTTDANGATAYAVDRDTVTCREGRIP